MIEGGVVKYLKTIHIVWYVYSNSIKYEFAKKIYKNCDMRNWAQKIKMFYKSRLTFIKRHFNAADIISYHFSAWQIHVNRHILNQTISFHTWK